MTTVFVLDDDLRSYVFIGDSREMKEYMQEAYSTDPVYRRLVNSIDRYSTITTKLKKIS